MKILKFGHIYEEGGALHIQGFEVEFGAEGLFLGELAISRLIVVGIIERLQNELRRDDSLMIRTNYILKSRPQ